MMPGYVITPKGHMRPFTEWREIRRGYNKGMFEIAMPNGRPKRLIVNRNQIHRFPREEG
jgi:hypothetical protein